MNLTFNKSSETALPRNGDFIVGVFKTLEKLKIKCRKGENIWICYWHYDRKHFLTDKDGYWKLTVHDDAFYEDDPVFWMLYTDFTKKIRKEL